TEVAESHVTTAAGQADLPVRPLHDRHASGTRDAGQPVEPLATAALERSPPPLLPVESLTISHVCHGGDLGIEWERAGPNHVGRSAPDQACVEVVLQGHEIP